jgi:hypothetical protein
MLVPALVGRTATSETHPSLPELPIPATILPFRGKLVSLANAFVLFDSHLQVDRWNLPFLWLWIWEHIRPENAMHTCAKRDMFRPHTSHVLQRRPGSPPMLVIVNDVLLEPRALLGWDRTLLGE